MGAPILQSLLEAGFTVTVHGDNLLVAPRDRLTDELRQAIRKHKPEILAALAEADTDDRRHCATCWNLDGNRCKAHRVLVLDDLPRRCWHYNPYPDDPDQRLGRERWPSLKEIAP